MKKYISLLASACLSLGLMTAQAQSSSQGRSTDGPHFDGATGKLFGENQSFTAALEFQMTDPASGNSLTMPGKISFDAGKSRFEMNMADMKGTKLRPGAAAHMKSMGMDQTINISRPDKKVAWLVYPGMQSYVENQLTGAAADTGSDFKIETTEVGKETVEGHDCIKHKVVVTDKNGDKHESTVWNATDLKKFPVKIERIEQERQIVMLFKDVLFDKPSASVFEAPTGFTKYPSMQALMQEFMKKRMGGTMMEKP